MKYCFLATYLLFYISPSLYIYFNTIFFNLCYFSEILQTNYLLLYHMDKKEANDFPNWEKSSSKLQIVMLI